MAYPMLEFYVVFEDLNAEDENTEKKAFVPLGIYGNRQQATDYCQDKQSYSKTKQKPKLITRTFEIDPDIIWKILYELQIRGLRD